MLTLLMDLPEGETLIGDSDGLVYLHAVPNGMLESGATYALHYEDDSYGEPALQSFLVVLEPRSDDSHFHGCPTPQGRPFDCDYCQERARGRGGA